MLETRCNHFRMPMISDMSLCCTLMQMLCVWATSILSCITKIGPKRETFVGKPVISLIMILI